MTARVQVALAATVALVSGLACTSVDSRVPPQPGRTLRCNSFDLQLPALDESMAPEWASFQVAQLNQGALAPLGPEERKALFEACVLPALVGAR